MRTQAIFVWDRVAMATRQKADSRPSGAPPVCTGAPRSQRLDWLTEIFRFTAKKSFLGPNVCMATDLGEFFFFFFNCILFYRVSSILSKRVGCPCTILRTGRCDILSLSQQLPPCVLFHFQIFQNHMNRFFLCVCVFDDFIILVFVLKFTVKSVPEVKLQSLHA